MRSIMVLACVLGLGVAGYALAQTTRNSGGGNQQLMQQMQQLAAERTRLQAENARMKKELDEARKERDSLKSSKDMNDKRAQSSAAALARAAQERDASETELSRVKDQTQELVSKFRETIAELRKAESDRTTLTETLSTRDTELKTCVANNATLFQLNDEVLTRLEDQGFWSAMGRAEPFTKLKRTQLENFADEYRGKAEDAQVLPPTAATQPGG